MTMQKALAEAQRLNLFARPIENPGFRYNYRDNNGRMLLHVSGTDSRGHNRSAFCRTLTQPEIESEWILCDEYGMVSSGLGSRLKLSDLLN